MSTSVVFSFVHSFLCDVYFVFRCRCIYAVIMRVRVSHLLYKARMYILGSSLDVHIARNKVAVEVRNYWL